MKNKKLEIGNFLNEGLKSCQMSNVTGGGEGDIIIQSLGGPGYVPAGGTGNTTIPIIGGSGTTPKAPISNSNT